MIMMAPGLAVLQKGILVIDGDSTVGTARRQASNSEEDSRYRLTLSPSKRFHLDLLEAVSLWD